MEKNAAVGLIAITSLASADKSWSVSTDLLDRVLTFAVRNLLLARQSGTLGLISALGSEYAWVRDNVYCSAAIWALALAYR